METRGLFHKIKIWFARKREQAIPMLSPEKKYGDSGEFDFVYMLRQKLPDCRIKKNIIVETAYGNAEIDCLVLYKNKLFAIEVKNWKGRVFETQDGVIKTKTDKWTGDVYKKNMRSPFKQLNRAISLLKKQIHERVWINGIVYFEDAGFKGIETTPDNIWFNNIDNIVHYIMFEGGASGECEARRFFDKCVAADCLFANLWDKTLCCRICDKSLNFYTQRGYMGRAQINYIEIEHHRTYDDLYISLKDGTECVVRQENAIIRTIENGMVKEYGMSKLDGIILGGEISFNH